MARTRSGAAAITIRGARENNLRNLDLEIPLRKLTVVTGVSGSGKSSLAFDTLYSEGQRLYVETFSAYTRQFLDRMDKPAVDRIEGVLPAIAIDQTNPVRTSRSTVGTMTELNDHLKLLFARSARLYCQSCGEEVRRDSPQSIAQALRALFADQARLVITFPVRVSERLSREAVEPLVRSQGYRGIFRRDGDLCHILQDRLRFPVPAERLAEDPESALNHGRGKVSVWEVDGDGEAVAEHRFSSDLHCARCDIHYREPVPNLFSFNSPIGACDACRGFGRVIGIDYDLVVPDESMTLAEGAIRPWQSKSYDECQRDLVSFAKRRGIRLDVPWRDLAESERRWVIDGEGSWEDGKWYGARRFFDWLEGRSYRMHVRVLLSRYRAYTRCEACGGARLKPEALLWRVGPGRGLSIHEMMLMPIGDLAALFRSIADMESGDEATQRITLEIDRRLSYLVEVGLGYLTLDRQSRTLSGGEVQRVNLTTALGTSLVNTLFVLDEPSIGLHPRDVHRLLDVLHRLRDSGNTIVVVEHDPMLIAGADHVIDMGPGAGERGGDIVFQGPVNALMREPRSLTGEYLAGTRSVADDVAREADNRAGAAAADAAEWAHGAAWAGGAAMEERRGELVVVRPRAHNLVAEEVRLPLGRLVALTGVSGSGKSTLLEDVLYRAMRRSLGEPTEQPGEHEELIGVDEIDEVVLVDQSAIGKSARSNPASYVGAFDAIRRIFAAEPAAIERGYGAGAFSFNSKAGQCPACAGSGFEHIEMQFLSDVYLRCPECNGRRFRNEVLEVRILRGGAGARRGGTRSRSG